MSVPIVCQCRWPSLRLAPVNRLLNEQGASAYHFCSCSFCIGYLTADYRMRQTGLGVTQRTRSVVGCAQLARADDFATTFALMQRYPLCATHHRKWLFSKAFPERKVDVTNPLQRHQHDCCISLSATVCKTEMLTCFNPRCRGEQNTSVQVMQLKRCKGLLGICSIACADCCEPRTTLQIQVGCSLNWYAVLTHVVFCTRLS